MTRIAMDTKYGGLSRIGRQGGNKNKIPTRQESMHESEHYRDEHRHGQKVRRTNGKAES
jgi:hypothetical protein